MNHDDYCDRKSAINNKWLRGGCVLAALFMAVTLFAGAETVATVPLFPPPFDKAAHFTYYGIMAGLRDASVFDWMADEIGTVIAIVLYWKWRKRPRRVTGDE